MKQIACVLLVMVLWLALTWPADSEDVVAGLLFSLLISLLVSAIYPEHLGAALNPRRWLWFALYVPYFLYYCLKANFDVAYRVLHPDRPIRPGFVRVRTALESEVAKTLLANSITLTPGTLVVDLVGQDLYVHWINVQGAGVEERTRTIARKFERILGEVFR